MHLRLNRPSWAILAALPCILAAMGAAARCAHAPPPEDVAELALTQASEAFTAWLEAEITDAATLPTSAERDSRVATLASINQKWTELEAAFDAAEDAYRAGRGDRAALQHAFDRALAFLTALGVQP